MAYAPDIAQLQARLGYAFNDDKRLTQALTHKSFANEHSRSAHAHNERLEFLGDAVLDLVVGHLLMNAHPSLREGELSVMRAKIVSEAGLAAVARDLDLGDHLLLGKGEARSGGAGKNSLLADVCEAVVAAVYLDGGFDAARDVVARLLDGRIRTASEMTAVDYKTRLQECVQAVYKQPPTYTVVAETGPDHNKTFVVAVMLCDRELARAEGKSKKLAEQSAACAALAVVNDADN